MKMNLKRQIAIILITILLASVFIPSSISVYAKDEEHTPAIILTAAHARIKGISNIDQLKNMKRGYQDYYRDLVNNPNLDDDQKTQITAIGDAKIKSVDERIDNLRKERRRKQRARSPIGILGSMFRGGKQVVRRTGKIVGKGINVVGGTVVRIIRDPNELMKSVAAMMVTGGTSSIKDALVTIFKSEVNRELKKAAYAEVAKIAYENPMLRKAVSIKEFLGVEGKAGLEEALEEYRRKQEEKEAINNTVEDESGDESKILDEVGYEGEGGYEDEEFSGFYNEIIKILDIQNSVNYDLSGEYKYTSINIIPATAEQITAYEEQHSLGSSHRQLHIANSPQAAEYEMEKVRTYVGTTEVLENGAIIFKKNGQKIEAELRFEFIADLIEGYEADANKRYTSVIKGGANTYLVFTTNDFNINDPLELHYSNDKEAVPWSGRCNVTFTIDHEGYIHAKGTYTLSNRIAYVYDVRPYYEKEEFIMDQIWTGFGLYNNSYRFDFVSKSPIIP